MPGSPTLMLFSESNDIYGANRWVNALAGGLAARGFEVVIARPSGGDAGANPPPSVRVRAFDVLDQPDPLAWIGDRALAQQLLDEVQPDLALVSGGNVLANLGVREELLHRDIPFLSVTHLGGEAGFDLPCPAPLRERIAAVLNGAAVAIGVSADVVQSLRTDYGLAAGSGIAVLNGRPAEYFAPVDPARRLAVRRQLGIADDEIMCFTSARVHPAKGYQHQLAAFALLRDQAVWSRLRFVWAGGTDALRRLRAVVLAQRLTDRVHLLGPRTDVLDLLGAADVFVLPTQQEGSPLAIIEAMARGLPVITTPVNGVPAMVGDAAVLIADPNSDPSATARQLAEAIQSLAGDADRRMTLGAAAHARAGALWREDTMIDRYEQLLRAALSDARR